LRKKEGVVEKEKEKMKKMKRVMAWSGRVKGVIEE